MTILLSNFESDKRHSTGERLIKIKKIESKEEIVSTSLEPISLEDEIATTENKLKKAEEKLIDLQRQKEELLEKTKEAVKSERNDWKTEKLELIEHAKETGHEAGFSLGKQEAMNEYSEKLVQANSIVEAATTDYHSKLEKSNETIAELAIHVAKKIVTNYISEHPGMFKAIITKAIKEIKDQSTISIYLHPDNYEFVIKQKEELVNLLDGDVQISIYIDQTIAENGCLIKHPFGQIDASVDTQLEQIRTALLEAVREGN